jgi:isoquinoline 1-oxidoreductase beta subunit
VTAVDLGRRRFLCASLAGGLAVGFHLWAGDADAAPAKKPNGNKAPVGDDVMFHPNAWLVIAPSGIVTVMLARSEMGQGVTTALPMIVAEHLEADWSKVRFALADADPVYGTMLTGGSSSVRKSWDDLAKAASHARGLLVAAAANAWKVKPETCVAKEGRVEHPPSKRSMDYGALAPLAAADAIAKSELPPALEAPKDDASPKRLLGKKIARLDTPDKTNGKAKFGLDVSLPGMLVARVVRCPTIGGTVKHFDATKAKAIKGVKDVVQIEDRVAVVADGYWPAKLGVDALEVEWDFGPNAARSSASISAEYKARAKSAGAVAWNKGDANAALAKVKTKVSAAYEVPFLAHAPMEPMNCTAHVRDDGAEVWAPTQAPTFDHDAIAKATGLPKEKIKLHVTLLGGGFGRRSETDFVRDAVLVSKAMKAPVKVIWSREDDMMHGVFRPTSYQELNVGLDDAGGIAAWTSRIVSPSILGRVRPDAVKDGIDRTSVEGAIDLPYAVQNARVEYVLEDVGVPCGFWRSVGNSQNAFVRESFVDELAAAAKMDPFDYRMKHLQADSRERRILQEVADEAGWSKPLAAGRYRGIAVHGCYGSYVATVVELIKTGDHFSIDRVVSAIDCGKIVNPDTIEAQVESGVVYALSAAIWGKITLDKGAVQERNFHVYKVLRMNQCPKFRVRISPNGAAPGGVGEPPVPPVAPALCNAIFAATGTRIRVLPIDGQVKLA